MMLVRKIFLIIKRIYLKGLHKEHAGLNLKRKRTSPFDIIQCSKIPEETQDGTD